MPVERKHKFRRNILNKHFTIPLLRTEQDTEQDTRKSVLEFPTKFVEHEAERQTKLYDIQEKTDKLIL